MTSYFSIIPCVRIVLPDTEEPYTFSDEVLIGAMNLAILSMDNYTTAGEAFVTPDISGADKIVLIFKTAKIIKRPPASFSYRTPVLSVTRNQDDKEALIAWYDEEIEKWEAGGHIPIQGEGAIEAYLESADRLEEVIDEFGT